jgi:hypothetical protein
MRIPNQAGAVLVLACLLLAACQDKNEPTKPKVAPPAVSAALPA